MHESDLFWKENATKLNDKDYELLKYDFSVMYIAAIRSRLTWLLQDLDQAPEGVQRPYSPCRGFARCGPIRQTLSAWEEVSA